MIGEFCKTVVETTKQGGNVLVPCFPSGIVYDLFECLAGQMDVNGLTSIPMFFVSPVADASLAYSNIMAEWLSASKQVDNLSRSHLLILMSRSQSHLLTWNSCFHVRVAPFSSQQTKTFIPALVLF